MTNESQTGVVCLQAKAHEGLDDTRSREKGLEQILPDSLCLRTFPADTLISHFSLQS